MDEALRSAVIKGKTENLPRKLRVFLLIQANQVACDVPLPLHMDKRFCSVMLGAEVLQDIHFSSLPNTLLKTLESWNYRII